MVLTSEEMAISKNLQKVSQTKILGILKKVKTDSSSIKKEVESINKKISEISNSEEQNKIELLHELDLLVNQKDEAMKVIEKTFLDFDKLFLECRNKISNIPEPILLSPQLIFSEFQKNGVSISLKNYVSNKKNTKAIILNFCKTNHIQVKASLKKDDLYDAIITQLIDIYSI
jgi:hypothetical protein